MVELHEAFDDCGGLSAAEADFASVDVPPAAAGISDGEASHLPLLASSAARARRRRRPAADAADLRRAVPPVPPPRRRRTARARLR